LGQDCPRSGRVDSQHHFICTRRWRIAGAKIRSNKTIGIAHASEADCKPDRVSWATREHAGAVERIGADTIKLSKTGKQIHHQEIGVLRPAIVPRRKVRKTPKKWRVRGVPLFGVKGPRARPWVRALRHSKALPEWSARKRGESEIGHQPAICLVIVHNVWVAVILV